MTRDGFVFKTEEAAKEWIEGRKVALMVYTPTFEGPFYSKEDNGWLVYMTMFGAD